MIKLTTFNSKLERKFIEDVYQNPIKEKWMYYQENKSIQQKFTPFELVLEIIKDFRIFNNKTICVVANTEIYLFLKALKKDGHLNYKTLTFITDIKSLRGKPNVIYKNLKNISKIRLKMTYNIVLTNVPFNENQNVHNGVKHKKQGRNLAKEFIYKCLDWADENLYVIAPVSRTYTSKVKRDFIAEGLYEVSNVKKYFPRVKVDLIACYSFDKKNRKQLNDCTVFEIPERNLGQIYTFTTGENIGNKKLEKILSDKGKYKIFLTTGNIKYTDSEEIVEMINDRTRGRLRVVMNHNASKSNVGNMHIAYPEDILTYSTNAFFIESVEQGNSIIEYLQSEEAKEILLKTRRSMSNSKTSFSAFPIPF